MPVLLPSLGGSRPGERKRQLFGKIESLANWLLTESLVRSGKGVKFQVGDNQNNLAGQITIGGPVVKSPSAFTRYGKM